MAAPWTPDQDKRLASLWMTHSGGELSSVFGRTRNACIGRAHRLGLPKKQRIKPLPSDPVLMARIQHRREWNKLYKQRRRTEHGLPPAKRYKMSFGSQRPLFSGELPAEYTDNIIPLEMKKLTIGQLTPTSCRWIVGDPMLGPNHYFFCGAETDRTYCAVHQNLCWRGTR